MPSRRSRQPQEPARQTTPKRAQFDCSNCDRSFTKPADTPEFEAACRGCGSQAYRAGIVKFSCECGNSFTGVGRLDITSRCYACGANAEAGTIRAFAQGIRRRSKKTHSCELCEDGSRCPLYERAAAE